MKRDVLIIATLDGLDTCARAIAEHLDLKVEIVTNRRSGLEALRRTEWGVVVVDESLIEGDSNWADQAWAQAGRAIPLEVNFAISGCVRLERNIKAALERRAGEQAILRKAVSRDLEEELKTGLTGLLLQSELMLQEPTFPTALAPKMRHLVELAVAIRERLR